MGLLALLRGDKANYHIAQGASALNNHAIVVSFALVLESPKLVTFELVLSYTSPTISNRTYGVLTSEVIFLLHT